MIVTKDELDDYISDMISNFLYYDRKEDDELEMGDIENSIKNGDISFFCEKDYTKDLGKVANANDIMLIIDKIRHPIRSMTTSNKEHTIKYIQNLCVLSQMYSKL